VNTAISLRGSYKEKQRLSMHLRMLWLLDLLLESLGFGIEHKID